MLPFPSTDAALAPRVVPSLAPRCAPLRAPLRAVLLAALLAVACDEAAGPIRVERAAIVPLASAPTALYFTVRNTSARPVRIARVAVEGASVTEMRTTTAHRMAPADSLMGPTSVLTPVASIQIPALGTLRFAPGGYSVVLDSLARPFAVGDSARVTVWLESGERARGTAAVVRYADLDTLLVTSPGAAVATEPSLAEGRALYASDGCAGCHGTTGHGDGPVAHTLTPPPRDFREASAFKNGVDESAIAQTIATGIPNGGAMPLYAHLSERERRSLARYVISLRTPSTQDVDP
ncbi:MAG: copper chaperone PCu(A)C [Gemmatimonadetes bacterium]|jgi:copper(I)-binding protein|nr:copper chaperone PCu(A)C [Gemmatimonadota bacterium]MBP7549666.1 copper chaperone PCu(A)C [Gemmatimonadaceae bacterium]